MGPKKVLPPDMIKNLEETSREEIESINDAATHMGPGGTVGMPRVDDVKLGTDDQVKNWYWYVVIPCQTLET